MKSLKSLLASCALLLVSFGANAAATYTFTGANYDATVPFTAPCATPNCANFNLSMNASGTFSGPSRLAPNLPGVDITAVLTGFNFTDGVTTYSSSDPAVRVYQFVVATDAAGNITAANILLERFQDGAAGPHAALDRFDFINIVGAGQVQSQHNFICTVVAVTPAGTADGCTAAGGDASSSSASAAGAGAFAFAPGSSIPTLSEYALLLLAALMVVAGIYGVRRNNGLAA